MERGEEGGEGEREKEEDVEYRGGRESKWISVKEGR